MFATIRVSLKNGGGGYQILFGSAICSFLMFIILLYQRRNAWTLLEGIMYGLPLITRPVGGIPDIVVNGENGFLIKSLSPEEYAEKISHLVVNSDLFKQISTNNIKKSELFTPEKVRERIYNIYLNVLTT